MSPLDMLWHVLNLFLPALGVGLLAPALAKLVWRRALKGVRYARLATWCAAAAALSLFASLLLLGRDGRIVGYLALVVASAGALWWAAFGPGRR